MKIYEFGIENSKHVVLCHPAIVTWEYFDAVISELETDCHLIVPEFPGYQKDSHEHFTSIEEIAEELVKWLNLHGYHEVSCMYGCSMGGALVIRMLAENKLTIRTAVLDGAITPYEYPWIITRLIALKDFCMISIGKLGGIRLLEKVFATDEYSTEDLEYIADIFQWISYRTIWRTFDSCNNYAMPARIYSRCETIQYWYGDQEERERKPDLQYIAKNFPQTMFIRMENLGHAGMALKRPKEFAENIKTLIQTETLRKEKKQMNFAG